MAKTKTFAEKMLKKLKPKDDIFSFKVIRPKVTEKGSIRYEEKMVCVTKGDDENKVLGL